MGHKHYAVIGAGAFGGWTALQLLRTGAQVTLVDAWGAGNSRASSGGESRVIRHAYAEPLYVEFAARALELWQEHCGRWNTSLYHPCGVLFLNRGGDFCARAQANFDRFGIPYERLEPVVLRARWPQIDFSGIEFGLLEPGAGYLMARESCQVVVDAFIAGGGRYEVVHAIPGAVVGGEIGPLQVPDGRSITADEYIFACGPWLPALFPALAAYFQVTRQELFFFGPPHDLQRRFSIELPVWAEVGEQFWYGIPGDGKRGFKLADDTRGDRFDPTAGDRAPSATGIASARAYLGQRFPELRDAPLLEARVCQYSNTPDEHFVLDRLPGVDNCWIAGGGSGHGFKHGPAVGEYLAGRIRDSIPARPEFAFGRSTLRPVAPTG